MDLSVYTGQLETELRGNILPFHGHVTVDAQNGGFYGRTDNDCTTYPAAPKGLVQHSRLLWTYSQAYHVFADPEYFKLACHAYAFLMAHFHDTAHGGFFWLVDAQGRPLDVRKLIYGQAFTIYGLAEYARATGDPDALDTAVALFRLVETTARDSEHGGYFDVFSRDWQVCPGENVDQAAGPVAKTMNTHLHLLEAITNLVRTQPDEQLRLCLARLIRLHLANIVDHNSGHLRLHFDAAWSPLNNRVSYGHDIEGSWLLCEAAEVLGEAALLQEVMAVALRIAEVTLAQGIDASGAILEEGYLSGPTNRNCIWWVQAEGMVGFLNAYQLSGERIFLEASIRCWHFVQARLIDRQYGDWLWGVDSTGQPLPLEKAGIWKTPYHNGRACLEIKRRAQQLATA